MKGLRVGIHPLQSLLISAREMEWVGGQVIRLYLPQNMQGLHEN